MTIDDAVCQVSPAFWTDAEVVAAVRHFAQAASPGDTLALPLFLSARQRRLAHEAAGTWPAVHSQSHGKDAGRHLVLTRK